METIRVTRDAADQRSGRTGRLGLGVAYRTWAENVHHQLQPPSSTGDPEADLAPLLLELMHWGVQNIYDLTLDHPPPVGAINQAKELLEQLGAIEGNAITAREKEMLRLPTHPRIAHMLLEGRNLTALATDIAGVAGRTRSVGKDRGRRSFPAGGRCCASGGRREVNAERSALERIERVASSWRKIFQIGVDNAGPIDSDMASFWQKPTRSGLHVKWKNTVCASNWPTAVWCDCRITIPLMRETRLAVAQLDSGSGEGKIFLAALLDEEDLAHRAEEKEVVTRNREKGMITRRARKTRRQRDAVQQALTKVPDDSAH